MPTPPVDPSVSTLTAAGLSVESNANLVAYLQAALQAIYGPSINLDSNSPDAQLINIFAQVITDLYELLEAVYASFTVLGAAGTWLDRLVALNGLVRKAGTATVAVVNVAVSQAVTLYGLDQTVQPVFAVQDAAGNQYRLLVTHVFGGPGNANLSFQCAAVGVIQTVANTIMVQATPTLYVTAVNNPTISGDTIGTAEENDAQVKIRHAQSFQMAATGPADSIEAALFNIAALADALTIENFSSADATYGGVTVKAHSVWCIVNPGTATPAQIAQAIYSKKMPGCGVSASGAPQSYVITRPNGQTFSAQWDLAVAQPLYIKFTAIAKYANVPINKAAYPIALAAALQYRLGQNPAIVDVISAMQSVDSNAVITFTGGQGLSSDNSTFVIGTVSPDTPQKYFTVNVGNIAVS